MEKDQLIILGFLFFAFLIILLYNKIRSCCDNNTRSSYSIRKREYASGVNPKTNQPYTIDNKAYYVPKVEYAKDHRIRRVVDMYKGVDLGEINSDIENKTYNANWLDVKEKYSQDSSKECYDGCSVDPEGPREPYLLKNPSGVQQVSAKLPSIPTEPENVNPWRYKQQPIYEMYDDFQLSPIILKKIQEIENKLDVYNNSELNSPLPPPQYLQVIESRPMSWAPNKNPIYYPHLRRELPY